MKPLVALVGRPNVGKSTLFNSLAKARISIVEDIPGITRDRIYTDVSWYDREFTIIDTGGIEPKSKDIILSQMREQAQIAIDTAHVIVFITDVQSGMTDDDMEIANMLRRSQKPTVLAVNKVDSFKKQEAETFEFYQLGLGEPIAISAEQKLGLGDLLDEVLKYFPEKAEIEEEDDRIKVAIVGKPNTGKSSLINRVLGKNRLIVSEIAGTTRDAVDTEVKYGDREYVFIDTAGIRRHAKIKEDLEHYMVLRAVSAVERSDVAILVIDAEEGVTEQDAKIAGIIHDRGKGCIIAVNKWDLIEKDNNTVKKFDEKIRSVLSFMPYAEIVYISALTGQRVTKLFSMIEKVDENCSLRIKTGVLNEIVSEATALQAPPTDKGKPLKIYYVTQVSVKPPTFAVFVNSKKQAHFSYMRYIENKIREAFGFFGTPIVLLIREKKRDQK